MSQAPSPSSSSAKILDGSVIVEWSRCAEYQIIAAGPMTRPYRVILARFANQGMLCNCREYIHGDGGRLLDSSTYRPESDLQQAVEQFADQVAEGLEYIPCLFRGDGPKFISV